MKSWRFKVRTCPATVHTRESDQIVSHSSNHNHFATPEHIELLQFRNQLKRRVLAESIPIGRVYEEELASANLSLPVLSIALTSKEAREYVKICCSCGIYWYSLESSLHRLRRKTTPLLPTSSEFEMPYQYSQTRGGEDFLPFATKIRNKRALVFATDLQPTISFRSAYVFMDGIFSVCPPQFDQVFTMHRIHHDRGKCYFMTLTSETILLVIPCIIGLLPGRSSAVYQYIFDLLIDEAVELGLEFKPELVSTDYEPGLIKAIILRVCSII